ncbi:MAG: hypothetical protein JWM02_528 [Frankiales bacterium]|nr:hypothetical protein [Frankiales bacterium]
MSGRHARHRARTRLLRGLGLLAGLLLGLLAMSPAPAATGGVVTTGVAPLLDSYVDASVPTANYGGLTRLRIDSSPDARSYLRFDLSGVTGTVTRAILRITPTSSLSAGLDVRSVVDDTWTERGITFNNAPAIGPVGATSGAGTSGTALAVDVTSIVTAGGHVNLVLTARSSTAVSLASRESTTPPSLTVDTTTNVSPQNSVAPAVTGTAEVGKTLVADPGSWDGAPTITYGYQWQRCDSASCATIALATRQSYQVVSADVGTSLRVVVTATNSYGSGTATSASAAVVPVPPPPPDDKVIMAAGDMSCGAASTGSACVQQQTSDLLVSANPDGVLALGDNQYECGDLSEFQSSYAPSWGRVLAKTYPVPGNHEYATSTSSSNNCYNRAGGAPGYYTYFGDRSTPLQVGCMVNCKGYYSYDLGGWHLIALNSNCSKVGGCNAGNPQYTWLKADLAAHPNQCTLAYYHHPRWTSGQELDTAAMGPVVQALYDAGVDVILNGHDHDYERFAPMAPDGSVDPVRGTREFVVGTGGRNTSSFIASRFGSEVRDSSTFGVLKMVLHHNSYDWQFVPVTGSTSGFADSGAQPCHQVAAADTVKPSAPTQLVAAAAGSDRIDLSWKAASDNLGVVAYRIYRDGSLLTTVGNVLGYGDPTVGASTTRSYVVAAVDASGNESLASTSAAATTGPAPASPSLIVDGFETGGFSQWNTITGLQLQQAVVSAGQWAARSTVSTGVASNALKYFSSTRSEVWLQERVYVSAQSTALTFARLRNDAGAAAVSLGLSNKGFATYTNELAGGMRLSNVSVSKGVWHTFVLHANLASGQVDVTLDGTAVPGLSNIESLGTSPFARVHIGDPSTSHNGDFYVDDVYVGTAPKP